MRSVFLLLPWLGLWLLSTAAQDVRRRGFHSSAKAGNWIYVSGGMVSHQDGAIHFENTTFGIDLSKDWTNSSLELIPSTRPTNFVALNFQTLWWSEKNSILYCFGGETPWGDLFLNPISTPPESIWGFAPNDYGGGNWTEVLGPVGIKPFPLNIIRPANGASASDSTGGYYLGGFASFGTSPKVHLSPGQTRPAPGLLSFTFETLTMTNSSDGNYFASVYSDNQAPRSGVMVAVPSFGIDGILIVLGGGDLPSGGFNLITIYDSHAESWYSQTATGDIPEPRTGFCAVGAQGGDSSTFEIFIHGGIEDNVLGSGNIGADQIYILSLPAFHWIQANYTSVYPRAVHTCHATGTTQMIIIGGLDPSEAAKGGFLDNTFNGSADPWIQGVGVFDMTTLQWKSSYASKAGPYTAPQAILNYYSLNSTRYPSSWTSPGVQELFQPNPNKTTTPTPAASPSSPAASPSSPAPSPSPPAPASPTHSNLSHSSIIAIATTIPAFLILLVLLAVGTLLVRRHKKKKPPPSPKDCDSEMSRVQELCAIEQPVEMYAARASVAELASGERE